MINILPPTPCPPPSTNQNTRKHQQILIHQSKLSNYISQASKKLTSWNPSVICKQQRLKLNPQLIFANNSEKTINKTINKLINIQSINLCSYSTCNTVYYKYTILRNSKPSIQTLVNQWESVFGRLCAIY